MYQKRMAMKNAHIIQEAPPVPVEVMSIIRQTRNVVGEFRGIIKPVKDAAISSKVLGTITSIEIIEGQEVKKNDIVMRIDDELLGYSLDMAKANYEKSKVMYEDAVRNEKKQKRLSENNIISEDDLIKAEVEVKKTYNEMLILEADMKSKQRNFNDTVITAPFDGIVAELYVEEGETVFQQAQLFALLDIYILEVVFFCSDVELPSFKIGLPLSFTVDAYPGQQFESSIVSIDPRTDDEYLNFRIISHYVNNNPAVKLFPGMIARISTRLGEIQNTIFVPVDIVMKSENGAYLFIVKDGVAHQTYVTVGKQIKDEYIITSGIEEGDRVLVTGYRTVKNGSKITVVKSSGN